VFEDCAVRDGRWCVFQSTVGGVCEVAAPPPTLHVLASGIQTHEDGYAGLEKRIIEEFSCLVFWFGA
jgi:hypothetical protein